MPTNISPFTDVLLQLVAAIMLAVATLAITKLTRWLGLQNSALAAANLDDVLKKAVTFGLQQSQALIRQRGWDHIDVRNATLASALPYLVDRFPDTLRAVGVDMSDQRAVEAAVKGALDRAFPDAASAAELSPSTPPRTAPNPQTEAELVGRPSGAAPAEATATS